MVPREAVPNSLANWNHDCISWGVVVNWWFGIRIGVSRIVTIPFIRGSQESKPPIYHWLIFRVPTKNTFCMSKEFRGIYAKQVLRASIFPYFQKAVSKTLWSAVMKWGSLWGFEKKDDNLWAFPSCFGHSDIYQTIDLQYLSLFATHIHSRKKQRKQRLMSAFRFASNRGFFFQQVSQEWFQILKPLDATVCKSLPMSPISANVKLNIYSQ